MLYEIICTSSDGQTVSNVANTISKAIEIGNRISLVEKVQWRCKGVRLCIKEIPSIPIHKTRLGGCYATV